MNKLIFSNMTKIASYLDECGMYKEADDVDRLRMSLQDGQNVRTLHNMSLVDLIGSSDIMQEGISRGYKYFPIYWDNASKLITDKYKVTKKAADWVLERIFDATPMDIVYNILVKKAGMSAGDAIQLANEIEEVKNKFNFDPEVKEAWNKARIKYAQAKHKIDIDERVKSRDEQVTKQMIYSYQADIDNVQDLMMDRKNKDNLNELKRIANRTQIQMDGDDDYEGVLDLLQDTLNKYRQRLNELRGSRKIDTDMDISEYGGAGQLDDIINVAAEKHGVPVNLLMAVIKQESGFNPKAVSGAGAMGLMQLMPDTAKELGVSNPFDPVQNLEGGAKYLKQQYDKFGRWDLALAAYNSGSGNVEKYNGIPPFEETQKYVKNILNIAS